MTNDTLFPGFDADTDNEHHAASPTAHILDDLALYGYRPGQDEPTTTGRFRRDSIRRWWMRPNACMR